MKMPHRIDLFSTYVKSLFYLEVQFQCYKPIQHKNKKKKKSGHSASKVNFLPQDPNIPGSQYT